MSKSSKPKGNYRAYLVRLWQDGPNTPWRALTRNVMTQDEQHFASVEALFVFLQDQTKNVVVVSTQTKRVSFLSQTLPGAVQDKKLADHAQIRYRKTTTWRSDLGLQGYAPNVRQHLQPKKSRRPAS